MSFPGWALWGFLQADCANNKSLISQHNLASRKKEKQLFVRETTLYTSETWTRG